MFKYFYMQINFYTQFPHVCFRHRVLAHYLLTFFIWHLLMSKWFSFLTFFILENFSIHGYQFSFKNTLWTTIPSLLDQGLNSLIPENQINSTITFYFWDSFPRRFFIYSVNIYAWPTERITGAYTDSFNLLILQSYLMVSYVSFWKFYEFNNSQNT